VAFPRNTGRFPFFAASCGDDPVKTPNGAPVASARIPDATVAIGDSVTLGMTAYFADPDGDSLAFTPTSSDSSVALASASGGSVKASAVGPGTATVAVVATDPGGLSASQMFEVAVRPAD